MSWEAWGSPDDDSGVTDERCAEIAKVLFVRGAQVCRETMARFVEQGGHTIIAASIRANWNPNWGDDPGTPTDAEYQQLSVELDIWEWTP